MARTMVNMVATINKTNFGGRQMVTCWTCHRNRDKPLVTPTMDDHIRHADHLSPTTSSYRLQELPSAESILDKYIQASGGAQRLAGLTSFVGKGTSVGFGGFGGGGDVEIVAKTPDKRATIIVFKKETEPRGSDQDVRRAYRLGENTAERFRGVSVGRRRSGRGSIRRAVVFSRADQADSHEFEKRSADHHHRSSRAIQPIIAAAGRGAGANSHRRCRPGDRAARPARNAILR